MLEAITVIKEMPSKLFSFAKKEEPNERLASLEELKKRLKRSSLELNAAIDGFNSVTDPKLIDVYIYKIQSEQMNYDRILCEIKKLF